MRLSNSWKMVLTTFIIGIALPFVNSHLPESSQISEEFANNFIYIFLGSAGIGVVSKVAKLKNDKNADDNQTLRHIEHLKVRGRESPLNALSKLPGGKNIINGDDAFTAYERRARTGKMDDVNELLNEAGPRFKNVDRYYLTNFEKGENGNKLDHGEPYLWIKMRGVRSYATAQLFKDGNLIQVDQTDEKGIMRLELLKRVDGVIIPFERGTYQVIVTGDRGTSDANRVSDQFEIV